MVSRRIVGAALACTLALAGCTTMTRVRVADPPAPPFGAVRAGDTVVIQTRDGVRERVVVERIAGDSLVAEDGRRYERADIVSLERRTINGARTTALIVGIGAGVFLGFVIAVGRYLGENSR